MENLLDDIISVEKFKNKCTETDGEYLNELSKQYVKDYAFTMNDEMTFNPTEYPAIDTGLICKAAKELGFKTDDNTVYFNIKTIDSKAALIAYSVICFKNDIIREINERLKTHYKRNPECNEINICIDFLDLLDKYDVKYTEKDHYSFKWLKEKLAHAGYKFDFNLTSDDNIIIRIECK